MVACARNISAALLVAFALTACGGGGGSSPAPRQTPTNTGNGGGIPVGNPGGSGPFNAAAFTCPSSDSTTAVASGGGAAPLVVHRAPRNVAPAASEPGLIAVTYDRSLARGQAATVAAREQSLGATAVRSLDFPHIGVTTRILAVPPSRVASVEAALRAQAGVRSVGAAGGRRAPLGANAAYTNDPYFNGFMQTVPPTQGATPPPATYHQPPYEESADVPGQWGMHAIALEHAFGYSQSSNGTGVAHPGALGSASVKIAIIDTGADTAHPELGGKIAYQKCFITNPSGAQSTSGFVTDADGHGTDVAGIAAAADNNALGFTGSGGSSVIYDYRVVPTPDKNCSDPNTKDQQCTASSTDIAAAIEDAVANHVNVINMSLGGGTCVNGVDPDANTEGKAVADALAAQIIVVAASGNGAPKTPAVSAPACDSGVIAAGASALADGQPNGAGNSNGSPGMPTEYVASYSSYGSPGAAIRNPNAWGIVAPGGDPNTSETSPNGTVDDLHWIENIYTSTPFASSDAGTCSPDYGQPSGTSYCKILIAGTSMSAPMVAGAAALIVAADPADQSPSRMKNLLCSTADEINDPHEGCGRLNVYRAMAVALGDPTPP